MKLTEQQYAELQAKARKAPVRAGTLAKITAQRPEPLFANRFVPKHPTGETITLRLPWPISLNKLYTSAENHSQKILSAAGRAYRGHAIGVIGQQLAGRCARGRLLVTVTLCEPDRRARDIDNYVKLPLDCCTKAGAWVDDSTIDRLVVQRGALATSEPHLVIEIQELTA